MKRIYLMPGMGAGSRIYRHIRWPAGYEIVPMEWLMPQSPTEPLSRYVERLIAHYAVAPGSILAGMSFGGVIINEMSRQLPVAGLIFISTVKTHRAFPPRFRWARKTGIWRVFPYGLITRPERLAPWMPVRVLRKRLQLYADYMSMRNTGYFRWAMRSILHWKGDVPGLPYVHIHGTADHIFPYRRLTGRVEPVEGAGHLALMTHPRRVSALIADFLKDF